MKTLKNILCILYVCGGGYLLISCCMPEYDYAELEGKKVDNLLGKNNLEKLDNLFDNTSLGKITLNISVNEWNQLLTNSRNDKLKDNYVKADCKFEKSFNYDNKKYKVQYNINEIGIRIRGGSESYQPPEKNDKHSEEFVDCYNSCSSSYIQTHFKLKFDAFHDNNEHTIEDLINGVNLKCMRQDPGYVSEMYVYDLMRRYGVWTGARASYSMFYIQIGNEEPAYFGLYKVIEPVNKRFLKARINAPGIGFNSKNGFLWKRENALKTNEDDFETAKTELDNFTDNVNNLSDEDFYTWIKNFMDVELFIKTLAIETVCRKWDNYWGNNNNYYFYFDKSNDKKLYFISYDCDNSLYFPDSMESQQIEWLKNPNKHKAPTLIKRIFNNPEFLEIYNNALKEIISPESKLFYSEYSESRILNWYNQIEKYSYDFDAEPCFYGNTFPEYFNFTNGYVFGKPLFGCNGFFSIMTEILEKYLD